MPEGERERREKEQQRKRRQALRREIAQRPRNVRFAELVALLEAYGFRRVRAGKGDHIIYGRGAQRLPIPFRRGTMLPVYVREALALTEGEDDEPTEEGNE